jgi:tetratricopeptide (TPR) repeat protein
VIYNLSKMLLRLTALGILALPVSGQTLEQAERAFDAGKYADAARLFEKAQQESPNCESRFGLGLSRYRLQQIDAALIDFQSAVRCDPRMILAYIAMGEAYAGRNNDREALSAYLEALKLEPRNASALRGAASIYLRNKVPQKAVETLELLVQVDAQDAQAHVDLGAEYLSTGDQDRADRQFQEALRLKPGNPTALLGLANAYLRKGDAEEAIKTLGKIVKLAPNAPEPHFLLGSAYNRLARFQDALTELQAALRLGAEDSEVYYHLARAYGGLGRTEDRARMLAKFAEVTRKSKADTEAQRRALRLTEEAKVLIDSGDLNTAAARLEAARELNSSEALLFRLASVNYDLKRYDAARNYAEEAISLSPSEWLYHYLLGLIETRSKRWPQARASLQLAAQLNPSAAEVQNALGQEAMGEGDAKRAIAGFERAAELDPGEQAYRTNLESVRRAAPK